MSIVETCGRIGVVCLFVSPGMADVNYTQRGTTGLIDMPTAFTASDATTALSYGRDPRRDGLSLSFQALPMLETSLSFLTYQDVGGGQKREDAAFNVKYQIAAESAYVPSVAIGVNDLFGNDRESGEYIVASKSFGDHLTGTVGIGWGRLGGTADIDAPFGPRPSFEGDTTGGGDALFRGDAGLFGGVEWMTPWDGLTLIAEYTSDTFENEAAPAQQRLNYGLRYDVAEGLTVFGYARAKEDLGILLSFHGNPNVPRFPPNLRDGPPLMAARVVAEERDQSWVHDANTQQLLLTAISQDLAATRISVQSYDTDGSTITLGISGQDEASLPKIIGRTARVLSVRAPASVTTFQIVPYAGDLAVSAVALDRDAITAFADRPDAAANVWNSATLDGIKRDTDAAIWTAPVNTGFTWVVAPAVVADITAEEAFEPLIKVFARGAYRFSDSISTAATLGYQVNGDKSRITAPRTPSARSDGAAYDRSTVQLEQLYATYSKEPYPDIYSSLSFGFVERQYAAVTTEVLWAPAGRNWAMGADLSFARKRDYDDAFALIDYDSVTGFGSLYWDTGYLGVNAQVDVGRYLAGDWGASLNLSRTFPNRWQVSAFTTVTEGNVDEQIKVGMAVSIPLSWLAPLPTRQSSNISLGGPGGEFGARLAVPARIYPQIAEGQKQRLEDAWGTFWN